MVFFLFSLQHFFSETYLILRIIERGTIINVPMALCKVPVILVRFHSVPSVWDILHIYLCAGICSTGITDASFLVKLWCGYCLISDDPKHINFDFLQSKRCAGSTNLLGGNRGSLTSEMQCVGQIMGINP